MSTSAQSQTGVDKREASGKAITNFSVTPAHPVTAADLTKLKDTASHGTHPTAGTLRVQAGGHILDKRSYAGAKMARKPLSNENQPGIPVSFSLYYLLIIVSVKSMLRLKCISLSIPISIKDTGRTFCDAVSTNPYESAHVQPSGRKSTFSCINGSDIRSSWWPTSQWSSSRDVRIRITLR